MTEMNNLFCPMIALLGGRVFKSIMLPKLRSWFLNFGTACKEMFRVPGISVLSVLVYHKREEVRHINTDIESARFWELITKQRIDLVVFRSEVQANSPFLVDRERTVVV